MSNEKTSFKAKVNDFKDKVKAKTKEKFEWVKENHMVVIPIFTGVVSLVATVLNVSVAKDEIKLKIEESKTYTDPNTNVKWELRKRLNNQQRKLLSKAAQNDNVEETLEDLDLI